MSLYVIDDHPLMREAIAMVLRRIMPTSKVVELVRVGSLAAAAKAHGEPELICLDLKLPDVAGTEGVARIKAAYPQVPLAVISATPASEAEEACMEAGADLYIEKSAGASEMTVALRGLLVSEDSNMDSADSSECGDAPQKLSKRQKQLLVMIEQGLSNREIAEKLEISEHTVKVHLWRLFKRMNVKSRTQAVHQAKTHGWTVSGGSR
jgi:RNA polymerase sigma factor (sigma-70 family)